MSTTSSVVLAFFRSSTRDETLRDKHSMMDLISDNPASVASHVPESTDHLIKIYDTEPYMAFCEDLEFMWRWTIYQHKKLVQEGCSLTQDASIRAVGHVLAFYNVAVNKIN